MTQEHPITPPPELVQDWAQKAQLLAGDDPEAFAELLCNKAARWGADQELEACCKLLELSDSNARDFLYSARRPKPPSLKEQALTLLDDASDRLDAVHENIIRRALESLPE